MTLMLLKFNLNNIIKKSAQFYTTHNIKLLFLYFIIDDTKIQLHTIQKKLCFKVTFSPDILKGLIFVFFKTYATVIEKKVPDLLGYFSFFRILKFRVNASFKQKRENAKFTFLALLFLLTLIFVFHLFKQHIEAF